MVAASWFFHQLLDGLNTAEGIPLVALSMKSLSSHRLALQNNRFSVMLNLEFFYRENAAEVAAKEGAVKVDENNWETIVYVQNKARFLKCVAWKCEDTKTQWEKHRKFLQQE